MVDHENEAAALGERAAADDIGASETTTDAGIIQRRQPEVNLVALFAGGDHCHYVARSTGRIRADGKAEADYVAVHNPPDAAAWRMHLADGDPSWLVVIPIRRPDSRCRFGAIDIDNFRIDHAALARRVDALGMPLIVDRSKSGGAHLWLFLTDWAPAARVRALLKRWAAALGHAGVEVFPKQDQIDGAHDGNGIAAPYRKGTFAYGPHGNVLGLGEFISRAEQLRVTIEQAEGIEVAVPAATLIAARAAAPIADALGPGQRYPALFSLAGTMRRRGMSDEAIFAALMAENLAKCDPPHDEQTIRAIVEGITKYPTGTVERLHDDDDIDAEQRRVMAEFNDKHFVAKEAGQVRVYSIEHDPAVDREALTRSTAADFKLLYCNRIVPADKDDDKGNVKYEQAGKWWLGHRRRRQYERIAFMPGHQEPPGTYNLWRGFAVKPMAGDWSLLKQHMLDIVCAGDCACFDYLLRWMARKAQHPAEQGWTAVAMRGEEGVGKGIVAQEFGRLFGQHFLHVGNSKHLVGNFNLHLRDCVVLFADEAFWAGDKQGESTLKMLVTEDEIPIEGKHRDVVMGRNHIGIMMASNAAWVIPAGPTARRFFMLDVPSTRQNDRAYFKAIIEQMANGGRAAMLHDLLSMDLTGFEVRDFPRTRALDEQKLHSLRPKQAWLYDILMRGRVFEGDDRWRTYVVCDDLHKSYVTTTRQEGASARSTQVQLGIFLKEVFKEQIDRRELTIKRRTGQFDMHGDPEMKDMETHCYLLPDLRQGRQAMDRYLQFKTKWPEEVSAISTDLADY